MPDPSRGYAISAYSVPFSKGAKIYGANIQSAVVTSAHIAAGTVVAGDIGAGSVTSAKIGTGAVTNAKILANAVTSAKIRAAFLSGTISGLLSGVVAVAHGLGVKPKFVIAAIKATHANVVAGMHVLVSQASAATSANIFLKTTKTGNVQYTAYVQL